MPDLTMVSAVQCEQLDRYHSWTVGGYVQTYVAGELTCTCKGFQYHGKCKHVKEVDETRCTWHSMWSDEEQTEEGVCPVCGGPTSYVQVAV